MLLKWTVEVWPLSMVTYCAAGVTSVSYTHLDVYKRQEYLGVTPQEFFDEGNPNPAALKEFITEAKKLDSKTMSYILGIMKRCV